MVNVASLIHKSSCGVGGGKIIRDDLNWNTRAFNGTQAYADSKLMNVLFTEGLANYFANKGLNIKTVSLHPGVIHSELYRSQNSCLRCFGSCMSWPFLKSQWKGAQTNLYCSLAPLDKLVQAGYYDRNRQSTKNKCVKPELIDWFWKHSLEVVQDKAGESVFDSGAEEVLVKEEQEEEKEGLMNDQIQVQEKGSE